MNHTSKSGREISTFQGCTTLLMCPFCLEDSFSFCMTGFVIANITTLPKGRARSPPLNFCCEHGHLAPCTAHSVLKCHPEGSSLLRGERWHLRSTCTRQKAELWFAPEVLRAAELAELPVAEKKELVPLLLLLAPPSHHIHCMASAFSDPLLCPFTYWNEKPTGCFCSERSLVRGIPRRGGGGNFGQELGREPSPFGSSEPLRWLTRSSETLPQDSCKRRNNNTNGSLERRR